MSDETDDFYVINFVDEWLNHMNISSEKNIDFNNGKTRLDYFLPSSGTGILISEWKKPFSVQALNKALRSFDELELNELIVITRQVSEHAMDTVKRLKVNLDIIHPFNLSNLAMKFVSVSKFETPMIA